MSKRQSTIDALMLQLDVQSRAIRMTRADRERAIRVMKEIDKKTSLSDKKSPKKA